MHLYYVCIYATHYQLLPRSVHFTVVYIYYVVLLLERQWEHVSQFIIWYQPGVSPKITILPISSPSLHWSALASRQPPYFLISSSKSTNPTLPHKLFGVANIKSNLPQILDLEDTAMTRGVHSSQPTVEPMMHLIISTLLMITPMFLLTPETRKMLMLWFKCEFTPQFINLYWNMFSNLIYTLVMYGLPWRNCFERTKNQTSCN